MLKLVQFKRNEDLDTTEQVLVHEILANYQKIGTVYKIPQDRELPIFYPDEDISKILGYDSPITSVSDADAFQRYRYEITQRLKNWNLRKKPEDILEISSTHKDIKDLQDSDKILNCIKFIRIKLPTRILFSPQEPDLDENTKCSVFTNMTIDMIEKALEKKNQRFLNTSPQGLHYRIYEITEYNQKEMVQFLLEIKSQRLYQICIVINEGKDILNLYCADTGIPNWDYIGEKQNSTNHRRFSISRFLGR